MKRFIRYGGIIASAILIVIGAGSVFMGRRSGPCPDRARA